MRIKKSAVKSPDVLVARLGGAVRAHVAVVRTKGDRYHFVAPRRLGGLREDVPADSLTDCLNYCVWELNERAARRSGR